jgi:hypothetical protein
VVKIPPIANLQTVGGHATETVIHLEGKQIRHNLFNIDNENRRRTK